MNDWKERRWKRFRISERQLLTLLNWRQYEYIALPILDLPDGFDVVAVRDDFAYRGFDVLISHPSFDPVPEGNEIPLAVEPLKMEQVAFEVRKLERVAR